MIDDYLIENISAFHITAFSDRFCENRRFRFPIHTDGEETAERRKSRISEKRIQDRPKEADEEVLG